VDQQVAHLHLALPEQCAVMEFRRHPRVRIDVPAILHRGNLPTVGVNMVNLSIGGCRVQGGQALGDIEDRVALSFVLRVDRGDVPLRIAGIVRNVEGPDPNGRCAVGVEFVQMGTGERLALHTFVQAELYTD
jgi:hypothetical protein